MRACKGLKVRRCEGAKVRGCEVRGLGNSGLEAEPHLSRVGSCQLLTAGADNRFDELAVRVLVAALHELVETLTAIGRLVVDTAEVERAGRVVGRTYEIDRRELAPGRLERVAQRRGFRRHHEVAETMTGIES